MSACTRGLALQGPALLVGVLAANVACSSEAVQTEREAARRDVEANVDVIASGVLLGDTYASSASSFVADDSGVYWFDRRGAVFARRRGEGVVELSPGRKPSVEVRQQFTLGMVADAEHLYVGDAYLQLGATDYFPVPYFEPPARLLAIPKQGGPAEVVLELDEGAILPIAVDDERVILFVQSGGGGHQFDKATGALERLPLRASYDTSRVLGDQLYWSDADYPPSLLRARFDDVAPEVVAPLESNDFAVGPGYVLAVAERLIEPTFAVEGYFILYEEGSVEGRPLPSFGESISLERALDAEHAYWISYRPFDRVGASIADYDPAPKLVRVDVTSGALTRIELPGINLGASVRLLGQDASTVYVQNGDALLAVAKP